MPYKDIIKRLEYRRKWNKEWRKRNKDKVSEYNKKYLKKYQDNNKEKIKKYKREYRIRNNDEIKKYEKEYRIKNNSKIKKYRFENRDKISKHERRYRRHQVLGLSDNYVTRLLVRSGLRRDVINEEILKIKSLLILTKRKLKQTA